MNNHPIIALGNKFFESYNKLPESEQKKTMEFFNKFRQNPLSSAINYEKLNALADKRMRSVRIGKAYRGIIMLDEESAVYLLLWVDHHDEAYAWAKNKKCKINPSTGVIQLYDMQESTVGKTEAPTVGIFSHLSDDILEKLGVSRELFDLVRSIKDKSDLVSKSNMLPDDVYAGLELLEEGNSIEETLEVSAPKSKVKIAEDDYRTAIEIDANKGSYYVIKDEDNIEEVLSLASWRIFLHQSQRAIVDNDYKNSFYVSGGAGTGKTIVAMHRAKRLAQSLGRGKKMLFTTFTKDLIKDIKANLEELCDDKEMKKIEVVNLDAWAVKFLKKHNYEYEIIYGKDLDAVWNEVFNNEELEFSEEFYKDEWNHVIVAAEVYSDFRKYKPLKRPANRGRLGEIQRKGIWKIIKKYKKIMEEHKFRDIGMAMLDCRDIVREEYPDGLYQHVIVDEAQDFGNSAFKLIRALAGREHTNDIFIAGDLNQKIYDFVTKLSDCGISVVGRSSVKLSINYRTTEETRKFAFKVLKGSVEEGLEASEIDNVVSISHGPEPEIRECSTGEEEIRYILGKIKELKESGENPDNICIAVRTNAEVKKYEEALSEEKVGRFVLIEKQEDARGFSGVRVATMHRIKGLEFDHVFIAGMSNDFLTKLKSRSKTQSSLERNIAKERCLLYVAITRAKKNVYISYSGELCGLLA